MTSYLDDRKFGELSGIEIPADLLKAESELSGKLENLRAQLSEAQTGLEKLDDAALETRKQDFYKAQAEGRKKKDAEKFQKLIELFPTQRAGAEDSIGMLQATIPGVEVELSATRTAIDDFLRDAIAEFRAEMMRQYEKASEERALSGAEKGYYQSKPPKTQSKSRLATCERCLEPIAKFIPDAICQPMTGKDFKKLDTGFDAPPFPFILESPDFHCPRCNGTPFLELDKILTTAGFFTIPEKKAK